MAMMVLSVRQWLFLVVLLSIILIVYTNVAVHGRLSPTTSVSSRTESSSSSMEPAMAFENIITSSKRLCSRQELIDGAWHPIALNKPPYIPTYNAQKCYSEQDLQVTPWHTYEWIPSASDKCQFSRWNSNEFCRLAANKTILFVGDSLTLEQFSALVHLLHFTGNLDDIWEKKNSQTNFKYNLCDGNTGLIFRRSFYLEHLNSAELLDELKPDILILNRGAWDGKWQPKRFKNSLTNQLKVAKAWQSSGKMNDRQFIWRTTVPGHPECWKYDQPVTSVADMEALVDNRSLYSERGQKEFYWWRFKERNQLALRLLNESFLNYQVMDAYEINILRPDDHSESNRTGEMDCLHSCEPGKAIVYNELLLHLMEQFQSSR